ncbi:MAG: M28 family metallopeptidase [Pyrinomonadaceae bacterium]
MSAKSLYFILLLLPLMLLAGCNSPAPAPTPASPKGPATTAFDGKRAFEHVRKQVEFGPRPAGSAELGQARAYIIGELKSYGLIVTEDEFEPVTPNGKIKMVNIVAELPGESRNLILLASHYDTKLFKEFRFVGANDGGSSTGALMEIARVLATSGKKPAFTYRFVFFDGEEAVCKEWEDCKNPDGPDNTYGSRHYAEKITANGNLVLVKAMILLDMMGYKKLDLGRDMMADEQSKRVNGKPSWLVDTVWAMGKELGHTKIFLDSPEDVGGDDHDAFLKLNVPAMDIIQLANYPHWHQPTDTLDQIAPESLKAVGDTVILSLPKIEAHFPK